MIAQAKAEIPVEALDVMKAIHADAVERLYLMIVHSAQARRAELGARQ